MEIRSLTQEDCHSIANLHYKAFKNFFLTSLGVSFLIQFYKAILNDSAGIGVGVFENNNLLGFSVGTTEVNNFYKRIGKKNAYSLIHASFPVLVRDRKKISRLLKSLRGGNHVLEGAYLLSICVDPEIAQKGLGSLLISTFEKYMVDVKSYSLTTDSVSNDGVNKFYLRNGFTFVGTINQGERILNVYKKYL